MSTQLQPLLTDNTGQSIAAALASVAAAIKSDATKINMGPSSNVKIADAIAAKADSTNLEQVKSDLGIVENGDTAIHTISAGQYVIWKGDLYTADAAIPSGTTLASSGGNKNLTAKPNGLGDEVATANQTIANIESSDAIVTNGNTASKNISAGQFVYVKNHSTLATGMYTASSAIGSGNTLTSSNLSICPDGGFNKINDQINNLGLVEAGNIANKTMTITFSGGCHIVVFGFGSAGERCFQTLIYGRIGTISPLTTVSSSTSITVTGGTSSVTISSSSSNATYVDILVLSGNNNFTWVIV